MIDQLTLLDEPEIEGRWSLPDSWEWKPLGSMASAVSGFGFPKQYQGHTNLDIPFAKVSDMNLPDNERFIRTTVNSVDRAILQKIKAVTYPAGTIIFPKVGGAIATNKKRILIRDSTFDNNVMGLVIKDNNLLTRDWLYYFLNRIDLMKLANIGPVPSIRQSSVENLLLPIPHPDDPARSLATQRAIVARIEVLFGELRELVEIHEAIDRDVERLMGAVLDDIYPSVDQSLPENWTLKRVRELSEKPQYGYTQSAKAEPIGPKFLRITDIQDGGVDWGNVPYCEIAAKDEPKYVLQDGDIVFARSGATTGKTYLVHNPPRSVFASYLIRLRVIDVVPEFVYWFFQTSDYWRQVTPQGAALPNMNAQLLKEIRVPVPESKDVQRQIIEYVRSIREEIQEMRKLQAADASNLKQAEQAILEYAFRGEL